MIIEQERFEAWLFSQPDNRKWFFFDNTGCCLASFIKETTNAQYVTVGGCTYTVDDFTGTLPTWAGTETFFSKVDRRRDFTASKIKQAFSRLFPSQMENIEQPMPPTNDEQAVSVQSDVSAANTTAQKE